tara:strand:- start:2925 stop:3515 length:591 start_codon:yes stop_codon:yes gene_type:complete
MQNSKLELNWSKKLSLSRAKEYLFSRGHARYLISMIFNIPPLDIPLFSPPGKAPLLKKNLGFISISHSKSVCLIGWSRYPIGVDIEKKDRKFFAKKILERFYSKEEQSLLSGYESKLLHEKVLEYWLIKESSFKLKGNDFISDLKNIIVNDGTKTVFNKEMGSTHKYLLTNFYDWKIAVSYKFNLDNIEPLICYGN